MAVLIYSGYTYIFRIYLRNSVHCIHGGTALIFRTTLCPWLYEVVSFIALHKAYFPTSTLTCGGMFDAYFTLF